MTFEGWVRNHNNSRPVEKLTYYGYEALALNQGKLLISEACQRFKIENAIAMHRIGDLNIGDMAVWIGVSAIIAIPPLKLVSGCSTPSKQTFLYGSKNFIPTATKVYG